ncbi:hypothetical protein JTE90_012498 [Oedothorax gibbosus]|uniref:Ankyrin-3 n=1 Tax=Oedothorax gibbosus TaxID=931172 RepID=A0AAV6U5S6_9ARAC|nr:hypothetical protein JTE90_012498 [Oedothorax gibbosus]
MNQPKVWYPDILQSSAEDKLRFLRSFKNYDDESVGILCLEILNKAEKIAVPGDVDGLKNLNWFLAYISTAAKKELYDYFGNSNDYHQLRNILILICKNNKADFLDYLFNEESTLLWNLMVKLQIVSHTFTDEEQHNAFYYAVRSNNIKLLDILIHKWPNDYFNSNKEELDKLLSSAYEELKLKNLFLTDEMQLFVENLLIDFRFFHKSDSKLLPSNSTQLIKSRIEILTESVEKLKESSSDKVDEKFIFLIKFIARNVYVLKQQLKCTYSNLPWEEIEFVLIAFVNLHTTSNAINLIYTSVLNKTKILAYLDYFSHCLNKEFKYIENLEIKQLLCYPNLKREDLVKGIISTSPMFNQLYSDYKSVRDVHSLEIAKKYIELALKADPNNKEGQLLVLRALQVCGEYFKNTIETPKLSSSVCEMLLSLLPRNTREVITELRDSLSHSNSLGKRMEVEENADPDFFKNIQNDIKKINIVITEILLRSKVSVIKLFLQKIVESDSSDEIREIITTLFHLELKNVFCEANSIVLSNEIAEIENLVKEINGEVRDKTYYETQLLNKLNRTINLEKRKLKEVETDYMSGVMCCLGFVKQSHNFIVDENGIRILKNLTNRTLEKMTSEVKSENFDNIVTLCLELIDCVVSKVDDQYRDRLEKLYFKVLPFADSKVGIVKWVSKLQDKIFNPKKSRSVSRGSKNKPIIEDYLSEVLISKVSVLENILNKNGLNSQLIDNFSNYESDQNLQGIIEMLLMDIMSIFKDSIKNLTTNLLFLDENSPVLVGNNLRNHLAHGNDLFDVLQNKSSISIALNAKKIITENIIQQKEQIIGKLISNDPLRMKTECEHALRIIEVQNSLVNALKHVNLEAMKKSIEDGADIKARNIHMWTSLHFAAQGGNIHIATFLIEQNLDIEAVDKSGQTPIHIASAFGHKELVQLLLKMNVDVQVKDNSFKTPLHFAARNGHTDVIKLLLRSKASTASIDESGCTPIHSAITFNHREAAEILLAKQDINTFVMMRGFTALHVAAENGHLELVNLFLKHKADVNATTYQQTTALHLAALNGHLEVVIDLILAGAQMNVQALEGGTPLHYAVENNHKKIAELLLKNGADVNAVDVQNFTPLNFAAGNGDVGIVKLLLEKKSYINHCTIHGRTSLYLATENGHYSTVQFLLKKKSSVHYKDLNSFSALHIAAHNGHVDIVKLFVGGGAKINDRDVYQRTPLHLAALNNKPKVVATLISLGAKIECKDKDGFTPIHMACQSGHLTVVEQLISNGANLTVQNNEDYSPLFMAIASDNTAIVKLLIKKGADVNFVSNFGFTALHISALNGNPEIIMLFLKSNLNINDPCSLGLVPLHFAVEGNHREAVNTLVKAGANVDAEDASGKTPLYYAVENNSKDIAKDLVEYGADANVGFPLLLSIEYNFTDIALFLIESDKCNSEIKKGRTLYMSASQGQENVVEALIKKGADVDFRSDHNSTALHIASSEGHNDVVKVLLKNNAKLNVKTDYGYSPLLLAAISGHDKVVTTLLNAGANPNTADFKERTILEMAIAHNQFQVVKILLNQGNINVNKKGNDELTPLHIAAQKGCLEITKLLIENGANINAKHMLGSKPIHIAARDGNLEIVKFYLEKNIQLNDLNTFGQSLLHYAAQGGHQEIVNYLIKQNIDVNLFDIYQFNSLHVAAQYGYVNIIYTLLDNGAYLNTKTIGDVSAFEIAKSHNHRKAIKLLDITDKFFHVVKQNKTFETEKFLKEGAVVNVKSDANVTPLHYASWKGYDDIVNILLKYKANPNIKGKSGCTPLHYACKYNHINIVKSLLLNKAAYNESCCNGKSALSFATYPEITKLLRLINESFQNVQNGNIEVVSLLNNMKDKDILKIVMNACNKDNKTLLIAAIHSDFPKVKQLKQVFQDLCTEVKQAEALYSQRIYEKSLTIFKSVFEKRKDLLGLEHPDTLGVQFMVGTILYKQQKYREALKVSENVYHIQKELLGEENVDTLKTKSLIANVTRRLDSDCREVLVPVLMPLCFPDLMSQSRKVSESRRKI